MRDAPTSIHLQSLIAFHLDIMDSTDSYGED